MVLGPSRRRWWMAGVADSRRWPTVDGSNGGRRRRSPEREIDREMLKPMLLLVDSLSHYIHVIHLLSLGPQESRLSIEHFCLTSSFVIASFRPKDVLTIHHKHLDPIIIIL